MRHIDTFLARHPWAQFALSVLAAGVLITLLYPGPSFLSVVLRTAVVSVGGFCVVLAVRRREKRAAGGGTDDVLSLDRRLRTGEAPSEAGERTAMRGLVEQRLHRTRHRRAALAFLAVLFTTVTVLTGLTAGPRQTIGMAVLSVVFIGWMVYQSCLQNRRLHAMRAELDTGPRHGGPSAVAESEDSATRR
ncbi:hypothetical protein [Streptomyces sp. NPDC003832]